MKMRKAIVQKTIYKVIDVPFDGRSSKKWGYVSPKPEDVALTLPDGWVEMPDSEKIDVMLEPNPDDKKYEVIISVHQVFEIVIARKNIVDARIDASIILSKHLDRLPTNLIAYNTNVYPKGNGFIDVCCNEAED